MNQFLISTEGRLLRFKLWTKFLTNLYTMQLCLLAEKVGFYIQIMNQTFHKFVDYVVRFIRIEGRPCHRDIFADHPLII